MFRNICIEALQCDSKYKCITHFYTDFVGLCQSKKPNRTVSKKEREREQQTNTWKATACCKNTRRTQYTHIKYEVVVRARLQSVFLTVYIMYNVHCTQCVSAHGLWEFVRNWTKL